MLFLRNYDTFNIKPVSFMIIIIFRLHSGNISSFYCTWYCYIDTGCLFVCLCVREML